MTGPAWGLLGTVLGMARSYALIDAIRAPTPDELSGGVELSLNATIAGLGAFGIGAAVVALSVASLLRRQRRDPEARRAT